MKGSRKTIIRVSRLMVLVLVFLLSGVQIHGGITGEELMVKAEQAGDEMLMPRIVNNHKGDYYQGIYNRNQGNNNSNNNIFYARSFYERSFYGEKYYYCSNNRGFVNNYPINNHRINNYNNYYINNYYINNYYINNYHISSGYRDSNISFFSVNGELGETTYPPYPTIDNDMPDYPHDYITDDCNDTGTVKGTVTTEDGQPLRNALAMIGVWKDDYFFKIKAYSDNDGLFILNDVPVGIRNIEILHSGYHEHYVSTEVSKNETVAIETVQLNPFRYGSISGEVTDEEGEPLPGVLVTTHVWSYLDHIEFKEYTDEQGKYTINDVPDGHRNINFYYEGYYDNYLETNVAEGETSHVNAQLSPFRFGSISGRVTNEDGEPMEGVMVRISQSWYYDSFQTTTYTDSEGKYILDEIPDSFIIVQFYYKGYHEAIENTVVNEDETSNLDMQLFLYKFGTISGQVTDENGEPLQGVTAVLFIWANQDSYEITAYTDSDGRYTLQNVPDGFRNVKFNLIGYHQASYHQAVEEDLDVTLDVQLSKYKNCTISGQVTDETGAPVAGAAVRLWDFYYGLVKVYTNNEGYYTMQDAIDGHLTINVNHDSYHPDYGHIMVEKGEDNELNVTLRVIEYSSVSGRVTDNDGTPLEGAEVNVYVYNEQFSGITDNAGRYFIEDVPAAFGHIHVYLDDYDDYYLDVKITGEEENKIDDISLTLYEPDSAMISVTGVVTDENDTPLTGVRVKPYTHTGDAEEIFTDKNGGYTVSVSAEYRSVSFYLDEYHPHYVHIEGEEEGAEGLEKALADIQLKPYQYGYIDAKVTDTAGNPLTGALVNVYVYGEYSIEAYTDTEGKILIEDVPDQFRDIYLEKAGFISDQDFVSVEKDGVTVLYIQLRPAGEEVLQIGDIDGDGEITVKDAIAVLRHIAGIETLSPEQEQRADVNGDKKIDVRDAILILQKVVGLIEEF